MKADRLGLQLRELRRERRLSQESLAERAELSRNFVAQVERGESSPTVLTLSRIADALGVTIGELLGEAPQTTQVETVGVPIVADAIAAGPPMFLADNIEGSQPLPRSLLRHLAVDARQAVLVRLGPDQDSMEDTIPAGSTVLVDRAPVREIVPRGIYAVREESAGETGCSVKRLVLDQASGVMILLSDNPAHLPRAIRIKSGQPLDEVVVGRVVWWMP